MRSAGARLITIEGGEGAGKTSCIETVVSRLEAAGLAVLGTREPGGTALGEGIRRLLLDPANGPMGAEAETLLLFAARAEHLATVIRPALAAGTWVVCDRFTDATYAYQGSGRELGAARIATLEAWVHRELQPDLTLFLDVPVATGRRRAAARSAPDRFEREQSAFFERVRRGYLERAAQAPARIRRIDATQELAAVRKDIAAVIDALLAAARA